MKPTYALHLVFCCINKIVFDSIKTSLFWRSGKNMTIRIWIIIDYLHAVLHDVLESTNNTTCGHTYWVSEVFSQFGCWHNRNLVSCFEVDEVLSGVFGVWRKETTTKEADVVFVEYEGGGTVTCRWNLIIQLLGVVSTRTANGCNIGSGCGIPLVFWGDPFFYSISKIPEI